LGNNDQDKAKPRRASLPKELKTDDLTLDEALVLLSLPRLLGVHPEGGVVEADRGRFGPYIKWIKNENESVKQALYLLSKLENCLTFSMSGSGPTCFALFKDIETARKELTANSKLFKDKGYDSWVCAFLEKGITFI